MSLSVCAFASSEVQNSIPKPISCILRAGSFSFPSTHRETYTRWGVGILDAKACVCNVMLRNLLRMFALYAPYLAMLHAFHRPAEKGAYVGAKVDRICRACTWTLGSPGHILKPMWGVHWHDKSV